MSGYGDGRGPGQEPHAQGVESSEDFFASFKPVPPAKGEHEWSLRATLTRAECVRCRLMVDARLSQLQAGHAVSAELVLVSTGERYDAAKHGRCGS